MSATVTEVAEGSYRIQIQVVCDEGTMGIKLIASGSGVRRVS
jgi:hypothetical protein